MSAVSTRVKARRQTPNIYAPMVSHISRHLFAHYFESNRYSEGSSTMTPNSSVTQDRRSRGFTQNALIDAMLAEATTTSTPTNTSPTITSEEERVMSRNIGPRRVKQNSSINDMLFTTISKPSLKEIPDEVTPKSRTCRIKQNSSLDGMSKPHTLSTVKSASEDTYNRSGISHPESTERQDSTGDIIRKLLRLKRRLFLELTTQDPTYKKVEPAPSQHEAIFLAPRSATPGPNKNTRVVTIALSQAAITKSFPPAPSHKQKTMAKKESAKSPEGANLNRTTTLLKNLDSSDYHVSRCQAA